MDDGIDHQLKASAVLMMDGTKCYTFQRLAIRIVKNVINLNIYKI